MIDYSWLSHWLSEFEFLRPWWLLTIPVLTLAAGWCLRSYQQSGWAARIPARKLAALTVDQPQDPDQPAMINRNSADNTGIESPPHAENTDEQHRRVRRLIVLILLSHLIGVIALAGPSWKQADNPLASNRQAMVILFDLSPSMMARDVSPDRLTLAKLKLIDVLRMRQDGETALIAYAGDAHRIAPLSDDPATIETLVSTLHPDIMPLPGSHPERAVAMAVELIQGADLDQGDILLITDGIHPDALAAITQQIPDKVRLSILGVGSGKPASIPVDNGGLLTDRQGEVVMAGLDESALISLTSQLDGRYSRLDSTGSDIVALQELTELPFEAKKNRHKTNAAENYDAREDSGFWLVWLVIPLAALSFRRSVLWAGIPCLLIPAMALPLLSYAPTSHAFDWTSLWRNSNQQAVRELEQGNPLKAAELFTDLRWKAIALYRGGDYPQAVMTLQSWMNGDSSNSDSGEQQVQPRALGDDDFYNLGNALALAGEYDAALEAYDYALALFPDNADARYNRSVVLPYTTIKDPQNPDTPSPRGNGNGDSDAENAPSEASPGTRTTQEASSGSHSQSGSALGQGNSLDQSSIAGEEVSLSNIEKPADESAPEPAQDAAWDAAQDATRKLADQDNNQTGDKDNDQEQNITAESGTDDATTNFALEENDNPVLNPYSEQWLRNLEDDPGGYLRRKLQFYWQVAIKKNNGVVPTTDTERY